MIVTLALRVLQLIFAAVVLALSVILIKDYGPGTSWSLISYGAFCGGAGNSGGIAYATTIKQPIHPRPGKTYPSAQAALDDLKARCQETQASAAFIWFTAACFVGTTVIHFLSSKRGGGAASYP
ncbi:hypothetical protein DID88_008249 [Monilinia fructigena]|uniref:MARVEL domain-containing protein n=1 Tax=Monilinia fructigena TaxID=38457 RepID=A0A395J5U3_9HELO|nr:hypothetical protein DID88_008249 [Monilinia fructigena]